MTRDDELWKRAVRVSPMGCHSIARVRLAAELGKTHVSFIQWGMGSHICDVDGNKYIDYLAAYGPVILGHAHPVVNNAVKKQLDKGNMYGMNHEIEVELCEKIVEHVPCAEMVGLLNTGSEAAALALNIAHTYTRRNKVLKFVGHFHGWHNALRPGSHQMPEGSEWPPRGIPLSALQETIVVPWNDLDVLKQTMRNHEQEIAAVICEAIILSGVWGIYPIKGYLEEMRELTRQYGSLLIFDEIISGFRVALGGAQEVLGVTPDLAIFGKALANGYPISAIVGKKEFMQCATFLAGTYNSNPICTAAALANLKELEKPGTHARLGAKGEYLMNGLRSIIKQVGIDAVVQGPGQCFTIYFTDGGEIGGKDFYSRFQNTQKKFPHSERQRAFMRGMFKRGVLLRPRHFLTLSHTQDDLDKTLEAAQEAFKEASKIV